MNTRLPLLALALALAGGCTGDSADSDVSEDESSGMIEQAVEAQKQPMEKAQALEQQLQDAHQQKQDEIDRQSGDDEG